MVGSGDGEVGQLAVARDLRVDGRRLLRLLAQVDELLEGALRAVVVLSEGVDDPDLAGADSTVLHANVR